MSLTTLNLIENTSQSPQYAIDHVDVSTWVHPEYLKLMHVYAPLSEEQEHNLAVDLQQNGNTESAQTLVYSNLRGVLHIASDYRGYGLPLMDLLQEGTIGLMKAVRKFDPWRNVRLYTFAIPWIKAEIQEYILSNWKLVKAATTDARKKLFFNLRRLKASLSGHSQTQQINEIATTLNVPVHDVIAMETYMGETVADIADTEVVDESQDPTYNLEQQEKYQLTNKMHQALSELTEREQELLQCRFYQDPPTTLETIARRWGVSMQRVQQIEKNALKKMKTRLLAE